MYPVSNEANGTSVLLCQAQGMFPDLVKFTWKESNGRQVQASEGGYELLEQRDGQDQNIRITSMLIIDQSKVTSYQYTCFVKHEGEEKIGIIPKGTTKSPALFITTFLQLLSLSKTFH